MVLIVDNVGILQPLGVRVMRGVEFIRNTREYTEKIPGRDGEEYFGSEMEAGTISLPCFIETTPETWDVKEAEIMGALNPKLGIQELTFANKPGKVYHVLFNGHLKIAIVGPNYREFTLVFKQHDPYITSSIQSSLAGSGTAVNEGNTETPIIVEIDGPVTNPSVNVAGQIMTYTGTLATGDKLTIDTGMRTAILNNANALGNYNSIFPKLAVGNNAILITGGTVTTKWYNRFL